MPNSLLRFVLVALAGLFATPAPAAFPEYAIKIVVTIPPGGAPDIAARLLAQKLTESLGQPVVVENRTGANGNVAGDQVAKAAPDGYTLLLGADSLIAINPHIYSKMTLRSAQGPGAGRERGDQPVLPLGQSDAAGEDLAGIRRVCAQGEAAAHLCIGRQRQPAPARHRDAQAARRHRHAARALSRRRPGRHCDHRGRDPGRAGGRLQCAAL